MKTKYSIVAAFVASLIVVPQLKAQIDTKDQWQQAMHQATMTRDSLKSQVDALEKDVLSLRQRDSSLTASVQRCQDELLALVGRNETQEKEFLQLLNNIDSQLDYLSKLSNTDLWLQRDKLDTVQSALTSAKARRLALIPENLARLDNQQHRVDALKAALRGPKKENLVYTVGTWQHNRDCLWNIAKKLKIYDNPFLWPKIWEENRGIIKNPDIIHAGQHLMIPPKAPLTRQEKLAEDHYWKHKHNAQESLSSIR